MISRGKKTLLAAGVVAALLTACGTVTPVKEVTDNPEAYLNQRFAAHDLIPSVRKAVQDKGGTPRRITFIREGTATTVDGKALSWKSRLLLITKSDGIVQKLEEVSTNDLINTIFYSVSYKGIVDLRWQSVPVRARFAAPIYEIKEVRHFKPMAGEPEPYLDMRFTSGLMNQTANFPEAEVTCSAIRRFPATEIHKKLTGLATELGCKIINASVVKSRSKWAVLDSYGTAIKTEYANNQLTERYRVLDVEGLI